MFDLFWQVLSEGVRRIPKAAYASVLPLAASASVGFGLGLELELGVSE